MRMWSRLQCGGRQAIAATLLCALMVSMASRVEAAIPVDGGGPAGGSVTADRPWPVDQTPPQDTYAWVDPHSAFVMNGKLVWTPVRFDLWGHAGAEASALAAGLALNFPAPDYRKDTPPVSRMSDVGYATSLPGSCKSLLSGECGPAPLKDKVWFHSGNLNRYVVITWDDTFWNGQRMGDGYYKRDGQRYVRFDEVVPAFGGVVRQDDRGLVWVTMPPRVPGLQAAEACALNGQLRSCDAASFLFPEAVGFKGATAAEWILGYEADTGGKDGVYRRLFASWNLDGLKLDGKKPKAVQVLNEGIEKLAVVISTYYLANALGDTIMWNYFPVQAADMEAERDMRMAMAMADKAPREEVAAGAEKLVGESVLPENSRPPGRGFYYLVRSYKNPAPAEFQGEAAGTFIRPIPGYPGKYVVLEFGTRENGYWMDNYVCGTCIEAKGYHDFLVKDGRINPSFYRTDKSAVPIIVRELRNQVNEAMMFDDNVKWIFDGEEFMQAFRLYLKDFEPDVFELMDSRLFFESY